MAVKDLEGQRFGKLTVVRFVECDRNGARWECRCDCGGSRITSAHCLKKGEATSCGCGRKTHRKSNTRVYEAYRSMIKRCTIKTHRAYKDYGGRGITVCKRWRDSFENFYADMGDPPDNHTLDRIDNDKGYSPKNCCWRTMTDQTRNRRGTVLLTIGGESMCVTDWAERYGISRFLVYERIKRGWDAERALTIPAGGK